ncbi:hypothetical protein H4S14_000806 [Agrobacterium vitis]|nr:hypothetical protein [Agrobacterium vitis]MBE1437079.1 hypothetical protein [Agrobacterium vitis]
MRLEIDAKELEQLRRAIERLPGEIKTKAMVRAMRRLSQMARPRIVQRDAKHTNMPRSLVAAMTTTSFNAGGNTSRVTVESGWIPLQRLGAVQNSRGVYVKTRGSYRHAFVAGMKSGHVGVFQRVPDTQMASSNGRKREQIRELFGANPAHAITNNPEIYLDVMAELIQDYLYPRMVHEIGRLLET